MSRATAKGFVKYASAPDSSACVAESGWLNPLTIMISKWGEMTLSCRVHLYPDVRAAADQYWETCEPLICRHRAAEPFRVTSARFVGEHAFLRGARPFPFLTPDLLDAQAFGFGVALAHPLDLVQQEPARCEPVHRLVARRLA